MGVTYCLGSKNEGGDRNWASERVCKWVELTLGLILLGVSAGIGN